MTFLMRGRIPRHWSQVAMVGVGGLLAMPEALGNGQGMVVVSGSATAIPNGNNLVVNVSGRAVLNWSSFNIAANEKTIFNQPSPASIVWNQVLDPNPSHIFGGIQANGIVVLANESGFWFGPQSVVKAAGFVATTAAAPPPGFESGGGWNITISPPAASIINYGRMEVASGGSLFLVAEKIENHGVLSAPDGNIGLYAGKEVLVSDRPDGRGLSATVKLPAGAIDNYGRLIADAGTIALHAQVVNQNGVIQANSVRSKDGVVELVADDSLMLGPDSSTTAQGGPSDISNGGRITLKSEGSLKDSSTAQVSVAGGAKGGNGGAIEISAPTLGAIRAHVDGSATPGYSSGKLLIDPKQIIIDDSASGTIDSGTVNANESPSILSLPTRAFASFSSISLQATSSIEIRSLWQFPDTTAGSAQLTLESGGDITVTQTGGINAGKGWQLNLTAGQKFDGSSEVNPGVGSIKLLGQTLSSSAISAVDGDIKLMAGKDITIDKGYIHTTGGGNIAATAGGSIITGTSTEGYFMYARTPYTVSPALGGISTGAGGNVTLDAGGDVTSYRPSPSFAQLGNSVDAGTGAFGRQPGNVTIKADGNVYGHYVVANGAGSIRAGSSAGVANNTLALSLVKGSWVVSAADIALQEVRNPQGIFNDKGLAGSSGAPNRHLFDYDPAASVTLKADDSINLIGTALPRTSDLKPSLPAIYPPILQMTAGAGGVTIGDKTGLSSEIRLFPSKLGDLQVTTTTKGDFVGVGANSKIVVSDSGNSQAKSGNTFGDSEHAATPVHLGDLTSASLQIDGSMTGLQLVFAKAAQLTVGKDLISSSVYWQNNNSSDASALHVGGDIINRSDYTFYTLLPSDPTPDVYQANTAACPGLVGISLYYNEQSPQIRVVTLNGKMTPSQRDQLKSSPFLVRELDPLTSNPILDQNGRPICVPGKSPNLTPAAVDALYAGSQDVPTTPELGYRVAGPGNLTVTARNLDLGSSPGILSVGPADNPALALNSSKGASINLTTSGDVSLLGSAIISKAGGEISIDVGGGLSVGSTFVLPVSESARGIYSTAGSPVTVTAGGNINVNGSRIATYDGGTLTVTSSHGNIDAGTGGLSLQVIEQVKIDPVTHEITKTSDFIPGSGLLTATFSTGSATVGNIVVATPRGDVVTANGGIVQAPFNGTSGKNADVTVTAGTEKSPTDPGFIGNIDAKGSGIIGGNVNLQATGDINGLVFASGNAAINTPQNINVTVLAQGNATVSAGGTVAGTVVGIGSVTATGGSIEAALLSQNVTTGGGAATGQVGFTAGSAAAQVGQAASASSNDKQLAARKDDTAADDDKRKKTNKPVLVRTQGRVRVI